MEGPFNGGFFALPVWEAYYLEGLIHGGASFQNFTVLYVTGIPLWDTTSMNFLFSFIASKKQRRKKITQTKLKENKIPWNK